VTETLVAARSDRGWEPDIEMTPRLAALKALSDTLPGMLQEAAGPQLHRLSRDVAPSDYVVDIGTGAGKHALWLAAGVADRGRGRFVAVDEWGAGATTPQQSTEFTTMQRAFAGAGVAEVCEARVGHPAEAGLAWDRGVSIGLLHLCLPDDYLAARAILERWLRFVVTGGLVVVDAFTYRQVPARLSMELPRWYRWRSACINKAIYVKTDEAAVPRP
jgi:hypothetical protein